MAATSSTTARLEYATHRQHGAEGDLQQHVAADRRRAAARTAGDARSAARWPRHQAQRQQHQAEADQHAAEAARRVAWREMNSTTPTKMNSGDSQDRSKENSTAIRPCRRRRRASRPAPAAGVIRPWPTKEEVDQRGGGARLHQRRDADARQRGGEAVADAAREHVRRLAPNTRSTPVRTRWVPQTSSATAASRFSRCFM